MGSKIVSLQKDIYFVSMFLILQNSVIIKHSSISQKAIGKTRSFFNSIISMTKNLAGMKNDYHIPACRWQLLWVKRMGSHNAIKGVPPISCFWYVEIKIAIIYHLSRPITRVKLLHLIVLFIKPACAIHHLLQDANRDPMVHHGEETPRLRCFPDHLNNLLSPNWIAVHAMEIYDWKIELGVTSSQVIWWLNEHPGNLGDPSIN